ncbi:CCA tRNA nucleotidyltransferase [Celeribacter litoreus]|uniref:CCA tRNA nucleotidyltransferase n=1 Tax=Celeribacter litoreus TaxID=2876714 RepID=UPI001CCBD041|nr:CCA tRNA nucleotidyltransferase [Celeribacter litoreus]
MRMFAEAGEQAYFVGGCVRNSLLGVAVSDLDVSTSAPPEETVRLAEAVGLQAVPTGIEHGTITVVVDGEPFEITTFRKDVDTDGRRAVVAFSKNLEDDAHRRDFTMNALYAAADGEIIDPLGGLRDLDARRVRFIDDPAQRIREDYLRILRFFRFHAWYGDDEQGLDAEGLAACAENLDGLHGLSRERVGAELIKLLSAPDPSVALGAMDQSGVLQALLPGAQTKAFFVLSSVARKPDPLQRLAALGVFDVGDQLRLSKVQTRAYEALRQYAEGEASIAEVAFRENADVARSVAELRAAFFEQPLAPDTDSAIENGVSAVFPLSARDLMPEYSGAALGEILRKLEKIWIESGFTLGKEALLDQAGQGD